MQTLITHIENYQQELLDFEKEVKQGIQSSMPLLDAALRKLRGARFSQCPFCSAPIIPRSEAVQIMNGLNGVFDLPDTWFNGGFSRILYWVMSQKLAPVIGYDRAEAFDAKTEWLCEECYTGKLTKKPDKEEFRHYWSRQNLPASSKAIASRMLKQFPLITEMGLAGMGNWYILYDGNWYLSAAGNDTFVQKWGLDPREDAPQGGRKEARGIEAGYIYIIRGEGFFKVGCASNVEERVNTFAPKLPFETEIVFTIKVNDKYGAEGFLHTKFANKRTNGEWFKLDENDIAWIREWNGEEFKDVHENS